MDNMAVLMLHHGSAPQGGETHAMNNERFGEETRRMRMQFLQVLETRTKRKKSFWSRNVMFDRFYSADEAKKNNLIDKII